MSTVPLHELAATFGLSHHTGSEIVSIWRDVGVKLDVIADWRNQPALTTEMAAEAAQAMFAHREAHSAKEDAYRRYQLGLREKKIAEREELARQQREEQLAINRQRSEAARARAELAAQEAQEELARQQAERVGVEFASFDPRVHRA